MIEFFDGSGSFCFTMFAAFDMVKDPFTTLEIVIKLGFERVLTSGQDSSALEGLPTIKQLVEKVCVSMQQRYVSVIY